MQRNSCPETRHWCMSNCPNGMYENLYCKSMNYDALLSQVDGGVMCTRIVGHLGEHWGYGNSVIEPVAWDAE